MKELLKEYAELKTIEKANTERLDTLKPLIVEEMRKIDADKVELTDDAEEKVVGTFTVGSMTRWQYSPAVADLQEKEKATGQAKQVVSTVLRFTGLKGDAV